jgi:hypothetical protein
MSVFMMPKGLFRDIKSMMQNFWTRQQEKEAKIHWVKWDKMGASKCQGGLGFHELESLKKTLLEK